VPPEIERSDIREADRLNQPQAASVGARNLNQKEMQTKRKQKGDAGNPTVKPLFLKMVMLDQGPENLGLQRRSGHGRSAW